MLDRPLVQPREPAHDLAGFMSFNGAPLLAWGQAGQAAEAADAWARAGEIDHPVQAVALAQAMRLFVGLDDLDRAQALRQRIDENHEDAEIPAHLRSVLDELRRTAEMADAAG